MDYLYVRTLKGKNFCKMLGGGTVRIGRHPANDLILEDPYVSRYQADIVCCADGYHLLPREGKGKVFVNDRLVRESLTLHPGDQIRLGKSCLVFNASLPAPVEFTDRPLLPGSETTAFPLDSIPTPTPEDWEIATPSQEDPTPDPELSEGEKFLQPLLSGSSIGSLSPRAARAIVEADKELIFHRPLPEILEKIMDLVSQAVRFERGVLALLKKEKLVPQAARIPDRYTGTPLLVSRSITDRVIQRKEAILASDAMKDRRFNGEDSVKDLHLRSVLCVPLWNQKKVIGLIYLDNSTLPDQFTRQDLIVLTHLAGVVAAKIEHHHLFARAIAARLLEKDFELAGKIQKHLLPARSLEIPGYRLQATSIPCRNVGGDAYDYHPLANGRFAFALGDVAGKGLPAAMLMCTFQATVRALLTLDLPPDEILTRLNRLMYPRFPANRYVTFFFSVLDPRDHTLDYVNAGHDPPLLVREGRVVEELAATGNPVGSFDNILFRTRSIRMEPGDSLFCYTDGVTDSRNSVAERFGKERLVDILCREKAPRPEKIILEIEEEVRKHQGDTIQMDDITLMMLQRIL